MFWLLLAGGLMLRGIAQVAYEPALLFIDSKKYIFGTDFTNTIWGSFDPLGYSLLILRPILLAGRSLAYAALVQHVLGMAMAGALYALMLRRGVYRVAGGAGRGAGAVRRLPAERRADDHAGRAVRDAARGRGSCCCCGGRGPGSSWSSWAGWRSARPPRCGRWARR